MEGKRPGGRRASSSPRPRRHQAPPARFFPSHNSEDTAPARVSRSSSGVCKWPLHLDSPALSSVQPGPRVQIQTHHHGHAVSIWGLPCWLQGSTQPSACMPALSTRCQGLLPSGSPSMPVRPHCSLWSGLCAWQGGECCPLPESGLHPPTKPAGPHAEKPKGVMCSASLVASNLHTTSPFAPRMGPKGSAVQPGQAGLGRPHKRASPCGQQADP